MGEHQHGGCCGHEHKKPARPACSGHAHADHDHDDHGHDGCEHQPANLTTPSLAISGVLLGAGMILEHTRLATPAVCEGIFIAAILAGGWISVPAAWKAIRALRPDINLLMLIAMAGASVIGQWAEAAAVVFLFGVAEWLEAWADRRSNRAMTAMLEIAPKTARVKRDGVFVEVPAGDVKVDETVAANSGMNIPLDGVVLAGESPVNQAPITGESVPVDKKPGDTVFAGTINGEGSLEIRVTKIAGDTTLARIVRLVSEAREQKAPTQRFVDTFARYYTPAVALAALLVFLVPPLLAGGDWSQWLYRACVLLLIACPCALVISTPVSIVAALTALARRGVLVKGGVHLETVARLKALAVDKTGTITEGKPHVTGIESLGAMTLPEILAIAAAVDDHSPHPVAKAVVAKAKADGLVFSRAENFRANGGRGAEGVIDGHVYFVGNHRFVHELGVCSPEIERRIGLVEARGESVVVVGHRPHADCVGEALGIIAVGDTVRTGAADAIRALHAAGVGTIVMLSGDNQRTADHIAKQVGIDVARGDLLPEDKVAHVKALRDQHGFAGMVGDGVNDAPAMAIASVGIAMGAAGTDAAIETADIALMEDDLSRLADTVRTGRRMMGVIRFNIAFALGLKAIFLVLTLTGHASLWLAVLADTGATLLVIANSLRLLRGTGAA